MNFYSKALKVIGWIVLIAGVIGSVMLGDQFRIKWSYNYGVCAAGIISSVILAFILLGVGEIINILEDNRSYLKK